MSVPEPASTVFDREFLDLRTRLLDLAAGLDRIERAEGSVQDDARMVEIRKALAILAGSSDDRAEAIQMVFSLSYDPQWRTRFAASGASE